MNCWCKLAVGNHTMVPGRKILARRAVAVATPSVLLGSTRHQRRRTTTKNEDLQVRVLNIFRAEMFTPVFAISHGVRPISPGGARVARTARAALLSPRSGEKLGVLFRNRSIFVPRGLGDRSPVSNFGYIRAPGPPSRVHTIGPVLSIFWA